MSEPALLDAIARRYSCREFVSGGTVNDAKLALVLEAGRVAPSAFGLEPWRFIVVPDKARNAVVHACYDQPAAVTSAALVAVVALGAALDPDSAYVRERFAAEKRGENLASIYAAYRAHYRPDTITAWAQGQCNFAAAQMLLQAAHLGLASCALGGFDAGALARALALTADETPALLVALGPCAYAAPTRLRKPLG